MIRVVFQTSRDNRKNKAAGGVYSKREDVVEHGKQCRDKDAYTIYRGACSSHCQSDSRCGRAAVSQELKPEIMFDKWQRAPCSAQAGVLMTIKNGPWRISLDTTAHGVGHEDSSTVVTCRLLNSAAGMSSAKFCTIMLRQNIVTLKPVVRLAYAADRCGWRGAAPAPAPICFVHNVVNYKILLLSIASSTATLQ